MHPFHHAQSQPDKPAYIMAGSGETVTYAQLDARSNQGAQLFRSWGLKAGDVIAILMDNNPRFFEIAWAAHATALAIAKSGAALDYGAWRADPKSLTARARRDLARRLEQLAERRRAQAELLQARWLASRGRCGH